MHLAGNDVGEATVKLLYGEETSGVHLAEAWPLRLEDNPSYLNYPGENGLVKHAEDIFIGYRYHGKKKMKVLFFLGCSLPTPV